MKTYAGWTPGTRAMAMDLLKTRPIHTGEWQAMNTSKSPAHATYELEDVTFAMPIPVTIVDLVGTVRPDLPWAENHFLERVSGIPYNPPPSAASWPYAVRGHADHTDATGRFDHTYPERFWPKHSRPHGHDYVTNPPGIKGIRFAYGDLSDVVSLLVRNPYTRQAYLPVWFPEDTGAVSNQRVPCTLGYHFMIRDGQLSCRYYIRSCDMRRHFANDVYLACRLTQWVCERVDPGRTITPGRLIMHVSSLHCFVGDVNEVNRRFGR